MGDLNARTGNKGNIKLTKRCSNDLKTNTSGNTSIKVCNNRNLRITNGQTPRDRMGNFTCFNINGASVVDNVLAESPI